MAEIIVKRPWWMQPRNSVEVNKDAAALSGVRASIIQYGPHSNWRVNQGSLIASPTFNGTVTSANTATGEALKFDGSSTYLDYGTANIPVNEFTVIWGGTLKSIANFYGLADCINGANGWTLFYAGTDTLWFSVNGYGGVTNFSGWPVSTFHTGAFRYKSGVERAWFRNGRRLATEVDATSASTSIGNFLIGSQRGGGSIYLDGSLNFFYLLDKSLSDEAIIGLQNNPYQLFKSRTLRLFTAAAGSGSTGTVSRTNASDTLAASGTTTVTGSLAKTNAGDSVSASGKTAVVGAVARANASDTLAASGSVGQVTGTVARTNTSDSSSATGTTSVVGSVAKTAANDAVSSSGTTTVKGSSTTTNTSDSCAASGSVGSAVSGSVNRTNANDSVVASGKTTVVGTVSRSDAGDSVSASGFTLISGSLARANSNDIVVSLGSTTILGLLARANGSDSIAASGTVGNVTEILSTVERTAIFRAIVARNATFQRSKSVSVKFN